MPTEEMRNFVRDARFNKNMSYEDTCDAFYECFEGACDDPGATCEKLWKQVQAIPAPQQRNQPARRQCANISDEHLTAPFRFVPLNETICVPEEDVVNAWREGHLHDHPMKDGLCGRLSLTITFDGPMLIGASEGDIEKPLKVGDEYVIPGATMRGLTRASLEIAAFARLTQTNLHRRYGIRDFKHELFTDAERGQVQAGWLTSDGSGGYQIAPCDSWLVRIRDLDGAASDNGGWHERWLKKQISDRYGTVGMGRGPFNFSTVHQFTADGEEVRPDPTGNIKGVYVFSNASPSMRGLKAKTLDEQEANPGPGNFKKKETVFAATGRAPLAVPEQVWQNFIANNSTPSRHKPTEAGNWAILKPTLDRGERIPVFWVADAKGSVDDLGLVRVFKRSHRFTTGEVLSRTGGGAHCVTPGETNWSPDFVEALFGFVHEPETPGGIEAEGHDRRHLKGRVAFGFARLSKDTPGKVADDVETMQSAPKASFGPFYLAGTDGKDWSRTDVELAGRKRFPVRGADLRNVKDWLRYRGPNNNATSRLSFLKPENQRKKLKFDADIRVHNLTEVELGALVWVLTYGGDVEKRHLIGRAKTAGAGQAQIEVTSCNLIPNSGGNPPSCDEAMKKFVEFMGEKIPDWQESEPVKALLSSGDPGKGAALNLNYLALREHVRLRNAARCGQQELHLLSFP